MALPDGWWVYVAMPLFMALIGYVTKLLAIRMMFEPLEYRGWGPFGWQGVIPRRAARMAAVACDLITTKLIGPRDILDRLDPDKVAAELEAPLLSTVDEITREVMAQFQPGLWETLPESSRLLLIRRIQAEAPEVIADLLRDIRADVDQVFDLKTMVVTNLVRDKHLLNRIFAEAGEEEFRFIARSGIWFGFAIGCVQALTWALTHSPWILPLFGAFTGWFTDWLALKLIFYPKQPRGFGWLRWQGLFLARRERVTERYAALIAQELITPHNLFEALLHGPLADRVFAMVQRHVQRAVDVQAGVARPLVVLAVGSSHYQDIKRAVAEQVMERLPTTLAYVEDYTAEALDIKATLVRKMRQLTDEEFEQLIRPAFQADEWILITVGAVLGFSMGELQVLALERFA
ncbi:MAG: DUF445 domain-containing protein [Geodermatophilaceae bacterium]